MQEENSIVFSKLKANALPVEIFLRGFD